MIWFIIATTILLIILIIASISTIMSNKYEKMIDDDKSYIFDKNNFDKKWMWFGIRTVTLVVFIIAIILSMILVYIPIIMARFTFVGQKCKMDYLAKRKTLIVLMEKNESLTIQNSLYEDINKYNQEVISDKHWANSPWTNWYYCDDYSDITTIDY